MIEEIQLFTRRELEAFGKLCVDIERKRIERSLKQMKKQKDMWRDKYRKLKQEVKNENTKNSRN